jgi:hypothetical protein
VQAVVKHAEPRVGDIRESLGDPERSRDVLGVTADMRLEDGLARLIAGA